MRVGEEVEYPKSPKYQNIIVTIPFLLSVLRVRLPKSDVCFVVSGGMAWVNLPVASQPPELCNVDFRTVGVGGENSIRPYFPVL
jgi:hypothetical protein